jgi:hypothetical protein
MGFHFPEKLIPLFNIIQNKPCLFMVMVNTIGCFCEDHAVADLVFS